MLLAISLLTTSKQSPLSIKIIYKVRYVLYAAKAIYIPPNFSCRSEIVRKSSENPLVLGHLQNHHKFLSNHVICIEESQNNLDLQN